MSARTRGCVAHVRSQHTRMSKIDAFACIVTNLVDLQWFDKDLTR